MQFGAGVSRSRQTPATKAGGFYIEIAPVFLHQQVTRRFGHAKQTVGGIVDTHRLVNPVLIKRMAFVNLPTSFQLDQRKLVWGIAVHLVGRNIDEYRLRTMAPRHLQKNQRTVRVDSKIGKRVARRPVV